MAMDVIPLRNKACIQSWNKTLVGGKFPWRLGSAKIAWLLYVIPVACSNFLKALAVSADVLAVVLGQEDQISVSVAKSATKAQEEKVARLPLRRHPKVRPFLHRHGCGARRHKHRRRRCTLHSCLQGLGGMALKTRPELSPCFPRDRRKY